ncbi:MAG TPA: DUF4386 domain-containing protein [Nocardioides sp.]|jgi:hypothetical protein|nr:DUF4386 domain-containing protein [Nocardioides sp.]
MTITTARPRTSSASADPTRNNGRGHARAGGIFYLVTFAVSIPALLMLDPILNNPGYIVSGGHDTQVIWACFLDFVNALAGIGSAVAVYPVVKRAHGSLALGFVMSRMVEAAVIMIGVVALLTVVTLHQDVAGNANIDASALTTTGQALVAGRDWTFLFGPGFMACINAVLFGTLLYRSRLVPRVIPAMGLIGAPVLLTANMLTLFGHLTQTGTWSMLATLPVAAWELSVGFYLTFKGFQRSPAQAPAPTA